MYCQKCGHEFQTLVCDLCAKRRSDAGYQKLQAIWLRLAQEDRVELPLVTINGYTHIELFVEHRHTFCGRTIEPQHTKRSIGFHYFDLEKNRCLECQKQMRKYLET